MESIYPRLLQRGAASWARGRGARGAGAEPSEQEVLGVMMRGHDSMMAVLTARQRTLQVYTLPYLTHLFLLNGIYTMQFTVYLVDVR